MLVLSNTVLQPNKKAFRQPSTVGDVAVQLGAVKLVL